MITKSTITTHTMIIIFFCGEKEKKTQMRNVFNVAKNVISSSNIVINATVEDVTEICAKIT